MKEYIRLMKLSFHHIKKAKNKKAEILEEIVRWYDKATNLWRTRAFFRFLKRLKVWLPVIWNDEDWDECYLFEIMKVKVAQIRKEKERTARHVGFERDVKQMKVVESLLSREACFHEDYSDIKDDYKRRDEMLQNDKCVCPEELITWVPSTTFGESCSMLVAHHCAFCERNLSRWYKEKDKKEKNDLHYCMNLIARKANHWWS
jgi:hypothetical protein